MIRIHCRQVETLKELKPNNNIRITMSVLPKKMKIEITPSGKYLQICNQCKLLFNVKEACINL